MKQLRHLMSPLDFSTEELDKLFTLAEDIEKNPGKYAHACEGKKLATCFYEPSTRTRLSFESAMLNLGGQVLGFSDANSSSAAKGESVSDTIRVISCLLISVLCVIQKKARLWWLLHALLSLLSMLVMAVISTPHRRSPTF